MILWVPRNFQWIRNISVNLLSHKKLELQVFLDNLIHKTCKVDELGIAIIAKMCDVHVSVVMKDRVWRTQFQTDINLCDIILAYVGDLNFFYMEQLEVMSLVYGTGLSVIDKQGIEHNILQGFYINSSDDSLLDNDDVSTEQDSLDVDCGDSDDSNKSTHSMVENHELYVAPNSPHSEPRSELSDDVDIFRTF